MKQNTVCATRISLEHFSGVFNGWIEIIQKQLALGKIEQKRYFHLIEPHKVFVSRLLPTYRIIT